MSSFACPLLAASGLSALGREIEIPDVRSGCRRMTGFDPLRASGLKSGGTEPGFGGEVPGAPRRTS